MKHSPYFLYKSSRRVAGLEAQYLYLHPYLRRDLRLRQIFDSIISALDIDGGPNLAQKPYRGIFIEDDNGVHGFEGFQYGGPVGFGNHRARGPFELADGGVGVEADDERITEHTRGTQVGDVPWVEQIEAAVGEDQPPPRLSQPDYLRRYGAGGLGGS